MNNRLFEVAGPPALILMWSSAFIAGIIGVGAAPPMLVLFARFGIAGALLILLVLVTGTPWPRGKVLGHSVIAGLLMQMVQFGAFYTAMGEHVSAAVISLVQGLSPVVIAVFAGLLGETVTSRQWLGFGIGGLGVGLAVVDQSSFSLAGLLLCLLGLAGLSLGTVYQKRFTPGVDPKAGTAVHVAVSAPFAGILAVLTDAFHISDPGRFAGSMVWMVLINSMGAFLLLNTMFQRWDTTRVGRLFFATPVVTAIMAWLIIDQPVGPVTVAGLTLGVLGLILASRRAVPPAVSAAPADPVPVATPAVPAGR
ncbi:EamA family transporter [Nocardia yamanashiensis]|uniref:DMT family transporter n=1 Tax=Nocardia yamanashiensis TaxID=209247 RepID=UPI001E522D31|nr:EamA family transporter [Nocardia yamanashiensis]UGT40621.1 EamA family transporter [Nocardia yamanashiensis]